MPIKEQLNMWNQFIVNKMYRVIYTELKGTHQEKQFLITNSIKSDGTFAYFLANGSEKITGIARLLEGLSLEKIIPVSPHDEIKKNS